MKGSYTITFSLSGFARGADGRVKLFSFLLKNEHELVSARAAVTGPRPSVESAALTADAEDASAAVTGAHDIWVEDGWIEATVYDRSRLLAGNLVHGPAIVVEMDSTTLVLPGHAAAVHESGSLLIRPVEA